MDGHDEFVHIRIQWLANGCNKKTSSSSAFRVKIILVLLSFFFVTISIIIINFTFKFFFYSTISGFLIQSFIFSILLFFFLFAIQFSFLCHLLNEFIPFISIFSVCVYVSLMSIIHWFEWLWMDVLLLFSVVLNERKKNYLKNIWKTNEQQRLLLANTKRILFSNQSITNNAHKNQKFVVDNNNFMCSFYNNHQ